MIFLYIHMYMYVYIILNITYRIKIRCCYRACEILRNIMFSSFIVLFFEAEIYY